MNQLKILPDDSVDDLSSYQHHGYQICLAVMSGYLDPDLQKLQIRPLVHSRWLTLACRIFCFYTSTKQPSKSLVQLTNFCLKIYFPTWFNIKKENKITDGAKNFFKLIERVHQFPTDKVRDISMKVLQRNVYFAHSENVILGMLAEDDENIRQRAVDKISELCSEASATTDVESSTLESSRKDVVRQFMVPKIKVEATHFYELTKLDSIKDISQPPAVMDLDDTLIAQMQTKPLVL